MDESNPAQSAELDSIFKKINVYQDKLNHKTNSDKQLEVDLIFDKLNAFHT